MATRRLIPFVGDGTAEDSFMFTDHRDRAWFNWYDPKTDTVYSKPGYASSGFDTQALKDLIDKGL